MYPMPYQLTKHARRRIAERGLQPEHVYAAVFSGRRVRRGRDRELRYDSHSRCAVLVCTQEPVIVTAMRLTKRQAKRLWRTIR